LGSISDDDAVILECINDAIFDIACKYDDYSLVTEYNIPVLVGTTSYVLPTNILGSKIYSLHINSTTSPYKPDGTIQIIDYNNYVKNPDYPAGSAPTPMGNRNQGSTVKAYVSGANIVFTELPTTTHAVKLRYKKIPKVLAVDADVSGLSTLWDNVVVYSACFAYMLVVNSEKYQVYNTMYVDLANQVWSSINTFQGKYKVDITEKAYSGTW